MNKYTKLIVKIVSMLLLIIIPFISILIYVESMPNQYENTFLAEFEDKYDLLSSTDEKKIVFIGGSSLPFGLRSDLIEQEIPGYKVVNYGLYATLGTKFMVDTSKVNINEGDIIILSPELNEQTYSLYFNPKSVLQACDGYASCFRYISTKNRLQLFYNYYKYAKEKNDFKKEGSPDPIGIYRHDSFNEYGDIFVDRPNNIMSNGVDDTMQIAMSEVLLNDEFLGYINDYIKYANKKGANVYFNYSPCNELAIASSKAKRSDFQNKLKNSIDCELLLDIEDCIIDYRYFYDTNFHLNFSGAIYYTAQLIKGIKQQLGVGNTGELSFEIPAPPSIEEEEIVEPIPTESKIAFEDYKGEANNDYQEYFNYKLVGSSYQIVGIKDEYKNLEKVILPSTYNGKNITAITKNALSGCVYLKEVYIGLTYKTFEEDCFNGCVNLEKIYLFEMDGNKLSPASSGLLNGTSKNIKIYIPVGSNYYTGYTWSNYTTYFIYY